jgi:hypothetical protein
VRRECTTSSPGSGKSWVLSCMRRNAVEDMMRSPVAFECGPCLFGVYFANPEAMVDTRSR